MTLNFDEALAEHGSAKEAITRALWLEWHQYDGDAKDSFDAVVAPWILDNAAAIAAHQSGTQASAEAMVEELTERIHRTQTFVVEVDQRNAALAARIQALEDAPGPRPNAEEVAALRQRMDSLAELVTKLTALDTSDVLERLVQDVALLKDWIVLTYTPDGYEKARQFRNTYIGTKPATSEARKMLGLDVETPEPTPDFNWVETACYVDGELWGQAGKTLDQWVGVVKGACQMFDTKTEARAWVEAQFNQSKQ